MLRCYSYCYIGSVVTIIHDKCTVEEGDDFVNITILVDTPNCHVITVTVRSKVQSAVDTSGKNKTEHFIWLFP